jgi:hypothetical protein
MSTTAPDGRGRNELLIAASRFWPDARGAIMTLRLRRRLDQEDARQDRSPGKCPAKEKRLRVDALDATPAAGSTLSTRRPGKGAVGRTFDVDSIMLGSGR